MTADGEAIRSGPPIEIENLSLRFGDVSVLDGVDLTVDRGSFVALCGPNGAGKTTLLRTINGLLTPDEGTVRVEGRTVADLDSRAVSRRVATVPQETAVAFAFDVRDMVAMGRTPHRSRFEPADRADREAVDRAMERARVTGLADRPIDEVSGGERQRVLLARALAQETPVLLLDEPTANLDINHQVRTLDLVADLVADGTTVVAAIHDLDLAARYADRMALLADGGVVAVGAPDEVLTDRRLGTVFDTRAVVTPNPVTGAPSVTALAGRTVNADGGRGDRVHVFGGGPTARTLLDQLDDAGIEVTIGPLPRDDVAHETATSRGVPAVPVDPYRPPAAVVADQSIPLGDLLPSDADLPIVAVDGDEPDAAVSVPSDETVTTVSEAVRWIEGRLDRR